MNSDLLLLNKQRFNRLFPFNIIINDDMRIDSAGAAISKLLIDCSGKAFDSCFTLNRPVWSEVTFDKLLATNGQSVFIQISHPFENVLRGQFEFLQESNQLLFMGSIWFSSIERVKESGLTIADFAVHDPLIELLHVLKHQEIANEELNLLLKKVNAQKEELDLAAKEIREMALFALQSPNPVLRVTESGEVIMENHIAEELTSFEHHGQTVDKNDFWKFIAEKGMYYNDAGGFEVLSRGRTYSFLFKYLPEFGYFNAYGRDVTDQKKNEDELLRLSLLASINEDGVVFTDQDGNISWTNERFCKQTGYDAAEIVGRNPFAFCRGPLTEDVRIERLVSQVGIAKSFNEELLHYRKDGTWFWARVKGKSYQIRPEDPVNYFAMVEDITHEKAREEQLTILSQIAENNINGVVLTDKEGKITWVNASFSKMTGYSREEMRGKMPGHLLQGKDSDKDAVAYLKQQITDGNAFSTEILNYSKPGQSYWVRISGQPIRNKDGVVTGFFALQEDITSEKEIRQRLKESESQFRMALEKIGDNVWEYDFKTGRTAFSKLQNDASQRSYRDSNEIYFKHWSNIHPDDVHLLHENEVRYRCGEIDSHALEYRTINKEGEIKWLLDRGVVMEWDNDKQPMRLMGTHTDISRIKQTETELEQRVRQFQSLSENIPGVIYEYAFNLDGSEGFRYVSPAVAWIFGITPEEFKNYPAYIHPTDLGEIIAKNQRCKETLEPFYSESRLVVPGRNTIWHAIHSSYSYTDKTGAKVFTGYMMDITGRKNVEEALKANEEKYRRIIENMNLGLLEVDSNGEILHINRSFSDMSGYSSSEINGQNASIFYSVGNNGDVLKEKLNKRKQGEADAYELEVLNKTGEHRWWHVSGAPMYNENGEITGSIGILLDITQQKKLELALINARDEAEQLARTKEKFLANMSHEIRTPMNAIMGMSKQLAKTDLLPQQKFYLDVIHTASDNLLIIINDILDLSKIEAGKLSLENIGFQMLSVVQRAIHVLAHKAEEKGLKLSNTFYDQRISDVLIGDPYRLNQVLLNLLGNSIKFTERGSVELMVRLIENTDRGQVIRVDVKDTGIGMEGSFVKHLFDKFSQENGSISRKYGGTGLGMNISRELIALMGGCIFAESKKGIGTSIFFVIDFAKGAKTDIPTLEISHFSDNFLAGRKIMVTDDNELNRLLASVILENHGAQVIECLSGEQSIASLESPTPDLILMDVQMPMMSGIECTRRIRESGSAIPIIALTAEALKGEREKCLNAGMNDYISKPFTEEEFLTVIDRWLKNKPTTPELVFKTSDVPKLPEVGPLYDLSGLKEISRGNEAFVHKMVRLFCDQTPAMILEMITAHHEGRLEGMASVAHKIKPSIDNLKIAHIKLQIREIENLGKQQMNAPVLAELLQEVEQTVDRVIAQLNEEYPA